MAEPGQSYPQACEYSQSLDGGSRVTGDPGQGGTLKPLRLWETTPSMTCLDIEALDEFWCSTDIFSSSILDIAGKVPEGSLAGES